jgi:hypothetical protein
MDITEAELNWHSKEPPKSVEHMRVRCVMGVYR